MLVTVPDIKKRLWLFSLNAFLVTTYIDFDVQIDTNQLLHSVNPTVDLDFQKIFTGLLYICFNNMCHLFQIVINNKCHQELSMHFKTTAVLSMGRDIFRGRFVGLTTQSFQSVMASKNMFFITNSSYKRKGLWWRDKHLCIADLWIFVIKYSFLP